MTTMIAEGLTGMRPISLDELVNRAELLTRVDRKYVIPVEEAHTIMARLKNSAQVLEIDGQREFGYRSTYHDTPRRDSFLVSGLSQQNRWKVRTRTYIDSGSSWLEVKTRVARDRTLKQRISYVDDNLLLSDEGTNFVGGILNPLISIALEPVITTSYQRTTLYLPISNSRATIDLELGWDSLTGPGSFMLPHLAILETKTDSTPSEVDRLMWSRGHLPERISKYGVGMAALNPDLPLLKWEQTYHEHLGLTMERLVA